MDEKDRMKMRKIRDIEIEKEGKERENEKQAAFNHHHFKVLSVSLVQVLVPCYNYKELYMQGPVYYSVE